MSEHGNGATGTGRVVRIEVRNAPGHADPIGDTLIREAAAIGVRLKSAQTSHVYLIEPPGNRRLTAREVDRIRTRLLTDPVTEVSTVGAGPSAAGARIVEVHPLPGVMDPVAQSVESALGVMLTNAGENVRVTTGWRYDLAGPGLGEGEAKRIAERLLANPVVQAVHTTPYHPDHFPHATTHAGDVREVPLRSLGDDELSRLSRSAHLFLSLEEMRAIREFYTRAGREPREIELETLAQTWSEHCVHKTMKARVRYRGDAVTKSRSAEAHESDPIEWSDRPGHTVQYDGSVIIDNLLKSTVAAATKQLIAEGVDWTLSVFVDNSGVIAFDDQTAVCVKVETHNHPSAIEPYGGAATGIGGCIRDVMGTGLGARPIANTDVFCVARPDATDVPEGCLPPRRILTQVVAGVRDYGNRMGIPTVNGAVEFDDRYVGNPLVFAGCIGVMPRSCVRGEVRAGDLIVAVGGRTGRDGIHGATFSSAELEHTATDEFAHAVQIGNAITQKQMLDAVLRARDAEGGPLFSALTDCGAGGFSSAIGEMGSRTGATVHLDRAPLKYAGLSPTEVWISEAQERMVLAVPPDNLARLERIFAQERVEASVLGQFGTPAGANPAEPDLLLLWHGKEVGRLSMRLLHDGLPMPEREAVWKPKSDGVTKSRSDEVRLKETETVSVPSLHLSVTSSLLSLLAHPTIASKHWIIRQYDHEVRGATAIKPLVGPLGRGPGDASVILPVPERTKRGLAIACGLALGPSDPRAGGDPYLGALAAIDECVRNLVCVGADPDRIAILDNFCWPGCNKPENMGALVRAAEGCRDGALAYRTPFVSGKDSLNNQFSTRDGRVIEIPPTLLITGIGIVPDIARACTMDAKGAGNALMLVGQSQTGLGGSVYDRLFNVRESSDRAVPRVDLRSGPRVARAVARLVGDGLAVSAHDVSDGGLLVAVAEMLIAGSSPEAPLGARVDVRAVADDPLAGAFGEAPSRFVLEVAHARLAGVRAALDGAAISHVVLGRLDDSGSLFLAGERAESVPVEDLARAWTHPLDW